MLRGLQRLGRWMFCLALIAQIGGVVPLVYVDTVHEYERSGDAVELAAINRQNPAHQHQPGVHDEHDQCCALHHGLVGMVADWSYEIAALADDRVVALVSIARVDEHPVRIDRPPRA